MISFDPEQLAAANREAERKIRAALGGSGTVRQSTWARYARDFVIASIAAAFVGAWVAWLWVVTA